MSEPRPWTPEELKKKPIVLDLYRSTITGKLFELYFIRDDGTALVFDIENMVQGEVNYTQFRSACIPESEFIGEDR